MNTPQIDQKKTGDDLPKAKLSPGDDGFQSFSARARGLTLSPDDLTALHQRQLLEEFFESARGDTNQQR